ncbi:hypothetical protein R5H30_00195 [Sulfitobacter sp. D35]|uniref:hypothetical protein n=1 Tax=Sulfitobacter sp. D35 TaxID=3083252 RepID=UPI00296E63D8|nr:hypothetical protein [Sulfitobacter sp. D35]MDW4496384.1 hypothetical protein [Sulfitobacter sp. D35]
MSEPAPVRRRRVFCIPGFDPVPARRYRELYRREAAEQARLSGYVLTMHPGETARAGAVTWQVETMIDGARTVSEFEVLGWCDIVRDSMRGGILSSYIALFRTVWVYLSTGAFLRLARLRKGPVLAALYPVGMLLVQLLVAVLAGRVVAEVLQHVWPASQGGVVWVLPIALGVATAWAVLRLFRARDGRLFAHYLMQDYAFAASRHGATPPVLERRLDDFRERIAAALNEDVDEVLVVGHSSGAQLAVSTLGPLLRTARVPDAGPALSLLTLGQVIPMVSFLPGAHTLRANLRLMAGQDRIAWVDVSAPGDGCAFALCDPVAVSGVAPETARWPLVFSAAFTQTLGPERRRALRWRFFRLHFQYLCAFDRPKDYDYFRVTAGPLTLGARFAGRPASRSRRTRPLSGYTSIAA